MNERRPTTGNSERNGRWEYRREEKQKHTPARDTLQEMRQARGRNQKQRRKTMMGYKQLVVTEIVRLGQSAEFAENEIAEIDLEHYERKYQPKELAELIIARSANGMDTEQTVKILTDKFNGNHWENYGHNRVYFDGADIAKHQGLQWSGYNSGNIRSAKRVRPKNLVRSEYRGVPHRWGE
jgi:hypothetical protein